MTEANQIESLQRENAALRQRLAELELGVEPRDAVTAPAPPSPASELTRLQRLFTQAPLALLETDAALHTRLWNQAAERLFGYRASEMLGINPYQVLLAPPDQVTLLRSWEDYKAKGVRRSVLQATTKDGRPVMCSWGISYLADPQGQLTGVVCFARDITAEQEVARARAESEALLAATFETADVGLCIMDDRGYILRVNSAYVRAYGWSKEELVGQHFTIVVPPAMRDWASQGYTNLVHSGFVGMMPPIEISVSRRDGSPLILSATYAMVTVDGGQRIHVCSCTDITERKAQAAQEQRRMQAAQLEAAEKTRLLTELDQKLEVIARQHQQILDLSAPVLDIWDGVLLLPLIGRLDGRRVSVITELLLQAVVARRTRSVILDMTSLEMLDTANVGYIATMVQSLRLLGVRSIITGIRPSAAQTMVRMGVDLQGVMTLRDLQQGLRLCLA